ncbi:MAG: cytochrome c biogenesis CcdA family protein [Sporichthyaceae bacterium]
MLASGLGDSFAGTVGSGSLLLAAPVALLAGLISFASPCVLPLVPGYLSYVTGLTGADLGQARRGRVLIGTSLFVLGFATVFVSFGALFGYLGAELIERERTINRVLGAMTIVLGLSFLGLIPKMQREFRFMHRAPSASLLAAPMLGVLFGVGWAPCIGPTLGAVQALAFDSASAGRGALLTFFYSMGLGLPFVGIALGMRRLLGAVSWVRRHHLAVMRTGGLMLCALGILLVTGLWTDLSIQMRVWTAGFTTFL